MDVRLVRWPDEAPRRRELRNQGVARLLLVEQHADPPLPQDCLEDWIRLPATEIDLQARLGALEERAGQHRPGIPALDDDGLLRWGSAWVSLPPVEARLTRALLGRIGAVVGRDALARAGWPGGAPGRNALDVHVLRLRRRLDGVGLVIRTVRSRGYLLEASDPVQPSAHEA